MYIYIYIYIHTYIHIYIYIYTTYVAGCPGARGRGGLRPVREEGTRPAMNDHLYLSIYLSIYIYIYILFCMCKNVYMCTI